MATRKLSAFAVYQQLMKDQAKTEAGVEEVEDTQEKPKSSVSVTEKSSRKRKREFALKKKKKRKLADGSDDESMSKKSKSKGQEVKWKKGNKSGKVRKTVSEGLAKRKKLISSRRQKKETSSESEQELSTDNELSTGREDLALSNGDGNEIDVNVSVPFYQQFDPDVHEDSREAARDLFQLLIYPVSIDQFHEQIWEKKPMVVRRHKEDYNSGWFSTQELDRILKENDLEFGTNIDITTYENGERQTHNPDGRAYASTVWEFFQSGCSVRLLNPATYSKSVWLLNSTLQEHFNSCVGANIYLTPADSQGFAPHYDDIEAFVLQLEGRKHWRVYAPKSSHRSLPIHSSGNFSGADDLGRLVIDTVLEPGDLLYFPRGFIHQANTLPDAHSLHITVSTYQQNTWGTLLEKLLPATLQVAMSEDVSFRKGLPMDCSQYMGIVNSDKGDPRRIEFCEKVSELMVKLIDYAQPDGAVDEIAADHIHNSLPPVLTESEEKSSFVELGAKLTESGVEQGVTLSSDCPVRLVRHGAVRLVLEGEETALYYTLQNSRKYQEKDLLGMQIHEDDAPAVEYLISAYPEYVTIVDLPVAEGTNEDKVNLCNSLYTQGLLTLGTDHIEV